MRFLLETRNLGYISIIVKFQGPGWLFVDQRSAKPRVEDKGLETLKAAKQDTGVTWWWFYGLDLIWWDYKGIYSYNPPKTNMTGWKTNFDVKMYFLFKMGWVGSNVMFSVIYYYSSDVIWWVMETR